MRGWMRPGLMVPVLTAAMAAAGAPGSRAAARHEVSYAYGPRIRQRLSAYWHAGVARRPALLILHGGYWDSGGRGDTAATARYFADNGFAVFSADYRRGTDVAWPGPRDDAMAALAWIRAHAAAFGADPAHVEVLGSEGGGQLATVLATYGAGRHRIDGAVALSPVASPYLAWAQAPSTAASEARRRLRDEAVILHRCHPDRADAACWARWVDSAARDHASGADDAPMYLVHSAGDAVPAVQSTELRDAEVARGMDAADVTVRTVPGSGSGRSLLGGAIRPSVLAWLRARARAGDAPAPPPARVPPPEPPVPSAPDDDPVGPPPPAGNNARDADVPVAAATYAYGEDPRRRLDAYHTPATARRPALMIIHGGYWYGNDKADWAGTARWFARRGYAVFSINYRLDTDAGWAAQRADALSALAWIRAHAAAFAVDPGRVFALGSSAGGQIAAAAGTYGAGRNQVRGVVALSPVASPYRAYEDGQRPGASAAAWKLRDNATLLARCSPVRTDRPCWSRWADAVVRNHAGPGDAPMLLIHSRYDFVPAAHSIGLCAALRAARVGCTVALVPGSAHGGGMLGMPGLDERILAWLRDHNT